MHMKAADLVLNAAPAMWLVLGMYMGNLQPISQLPHLEDAISPSQDCLEDDVIEYV